MLRMTGGWTSLDAGRKFSDTNCGFPQRSQPQSPPRPRKLWSHRRTSIFSKNFRDLGKFPCCLRFFAELCKFPRHLYFPKIREFPGCQNCLKNSRKLCKFPGHPILDFNLPGRRPICTSVIPPPPVFSAADNCELTERPHKCLDSDCLEIYSTINGELLVTGYFDINKSASVIVLNVQVREKRAV